MNKITYLVSSFNLPLIALSIIVAIISSIVALDIGSRLKYSSNIYRFRWITVGAIILGFGIWTMHFICMLAFHISTEASYHVGLVILSIILPIITSGIAFHLVSKPFVNRPTLLTGAFLISIGIISMNYFGMVAIQTSTGITYDLPLWMVSSLIAFVVSFAGLYLLYHLPDVPRFHKSRILSSIFIGLAASSMNFVAMLAIQPSHSHPITDISDPFSMESGFLVSGIGAGMLLILLLTLATVKTDKRMEMQLEEHEMKFQSIVETAKDAIIVVDSKGIIVQCNQGAQQLFNYCKKEIIGSNIDTIIPVRFMEAHIKDMEQYKKTNIPHVIGKTLELTGYRKDGCEFLMELSLGTWETEHGAFYSCIIRDITERRASEEKINNLVYMDSLTGLPNRRLFNDRIDSLVRQSDEQEFTFSLFYMDLDNFKMVNDRFGHTFGDFFLKRVTERLEQHISKKETLSRLGGDDFVLLLPNTGYNKAAKRAQDLINALNEPFHFEHEEIFTSASIGISLFPTDGRDSEVLIKGADIAMYRAKEKGKNSFQFFTHDMNESISRKSKLATGLHKGLERGEFTIQYQPQISLETEDLTGVEALLRWKHPEWGIISPSEFIPIAEETGSITKIGEFVLTEACRQNKAWQDAGLPPFRVAVNISARQFAQKDLMKIVENVLKETGLAPHYLELELTETIIQNSESAIATMRELATLDVHLSIDDFGTGYSSLSYLKLFPIASLKIDQHFTRNIETDLKDAALVKTIIRMAHDLGLNVIAEGVETKEQLEFLKEQGCNQAQGYYFNRPLPPHEIEEIYHKLQV